MGLGVGGWGGGDAKSRILPVVEGGTGGGNTTAYDPHKGVGGYIIYRNV